MTFPASKQGRVVSRVRRVAALDPGSRQVKLLLAETRFGKLRVARQESIDLQAEGLVSADETQVHIQSILEAWGRPPVTLVLPPHVSISQVIDLPESRENEVEKLIENETLKLSGVSERKIIYDFVHADSAPPGHQQFWVTFCQESDIRERIQGLGLEHEDLCEVTTTANSLIAASLLLVPPSPRRILVHLGAQTTVAVILIDGRGASAASFQMGGDFFTRALMRLRECSQEEAESLKHTTDLLNGPTAVEGFCSVVDGWAAELKRQLNDWFADHPVMLPQAASFELLASGAGFDLPGLLQYLSAAAGLKLQSWPIHGSDQSALPDKGFEVSFGAAAEALGHSPEPVSLLTDDYRASWGKRQAREKIELASLALAVVCMLLLALGTWRTLALASRKETLLRKVQSARLSLQANAAMERELASQYANVRPLFAAQQNSLDILKTLMLLQSSRSNRSFWYVLVADQHSYFSLPQSLSSTNNAAKTNADNTVNSLYASLGATTNLALAKPGCIAELCVPEPPEAARALVGALVNQLSRDPLFSRVDLLSDDLKRDVADPKVLLPDGRFVLFLNFAHTQFQHPLRLQTFSDPAPRSKLNRILRSPPPDELDPQPAFSP